MILFTTLGLLADVTWWIAPVTIVSLHFLFLVSRIGIVRIHQDGHPTLLTIRDLRGRHHLRAPFRTVSWWSYDFDDDAPEDRSGSRSNDVNVVLKLADSSGNTLCFVERITFDTRFPNEVPYDDQGTNSCGTRILVQRVDRLGRFLGRHLPEAELIQHTHSETHGKEQQE